jgi:hypothetical protein
MAKAWQGIELARRIHRVSLKREVRVLLQTISMCSPVAKFAAGDFGKAPQTSVRGSKLHLGG